MSLETGSYINDLVASNPPGTDAKAQGDDHLRLIKNALKNCFAGFTGAVVVTGTDGGAVNAYTLTTTPALVGYTTRMIALFSPTIANTGAATINISGLGTRPIVSVSNAALVSGDLEVGTIYAATYDGTSFRLLSITKNYADQLAFGASLPAQAGNAGKIITTNGTVASWTDTINIPFTFGSSATLSFGNRVDEAKGANIASAATINLTTATGNLVHITGTTTISAITIPSGAERTLVFDASLTLTNGANLILPTGADIITAANDTMVVRGDGAAARVISYQKTSGVPFAAFPYLKVSDQKASGTDGGGSSASDITQIRTFNTVEVNTIAGASLASNTVTLPAGTYEVSGFSTFRNAVNTKLFLYNSSDATYTIIGVNSGTGSGGIQNAVPISGRFTIAASKNFTLRYYISAAQAVNGLGTALTSGQVEVYSQLEFTKVA